MSHDGGDLVHQFAEFLFILRTQIGFDLGMENPFRRSRLPLRETCTCKSSTSHILGVGGWGGWFLRRNLACHTACTPLTIQMKRA